MKTSFNPGDLVLVFGTNLGEIMTVMNDGWFRIWIENDGPGVFMKIHGDSISHLDV